MKMCRNHEGVLAVSGTRCRECYNEYMRVYCLERYHRIRKEEVANLGGKCVDCGTFDDLEFDHADRTQKAVDIAKLLGYSAVRRKEELKKCVLRCAPCHRAKTRKMKDFHRKQHGEGLIGREGCLCDKCEPLKAEYEATFQELQTAADEQLMIARAAHAKSFTTCECGNQKSRKSQVCLDCRNAIKHKNTAYYPQLDELVTLIRLHGYVAAGRKIGVSDNALRKHLSRNGVTPSKRRDLRMPS